METLSDREVADALSLIGALTWSPDRVHEARLERLEGVFEQVAREANLSATMLEAIALVESDLEKTAENPSSGAMGLMQVMPQHLGKRFELPEGPAVTFRRSNWHDPLTNVRVGAAILRDFGAHDSTTSWWDVLNGYNGDAPPRDAKYEKAVRERYIGLLRWKTLRGLN